MVIRSHSGQKAFCNISVTLVSLLICAKRIFNIFRELFFLQLTAIEFLGLRAGDLEGLGRQINIFCSLHANVLVFLTCNALQGHNKVATVLFLLHRFEESIESCKKVLQLQPFHFAGLVKNAPNPY